MAFQDPKTDWNEAYKPSTEDMNRIEGNIDYLKSGDKTIDGTNNFTEPIDCPSVNTGHGDNEVYPMNQGVRTTDDVTFNSVTGVYKIIDDNLSLTIKPFIVQVTVSGASGYAITLVSLGLDISQIVSIGGTYLLIGSKYPLANSLHLSFSISSELIDIVNNTPSTIELTILIWRT